MGFRLGRSFNKVSGIRLNSRIRFSRRRFERGKPNPRSNRLTRGRRSSAKQSRTPALIRLAFLPPKILVLPISLPLVNILSALKVLEKASVGVEYSKGEVVLSVAKELSNALEGIDEAKSFSSQLKYCREAGYALDELKRLDRFSRFIRNQRKLRQLVKALERTMEVVATFDIAEIKLRERDYAASVQHARDAISLAVENSVTNKDLKRSEARTFAGKRLTIKRMDEFLQKVQQSDF